MTTYKVWHGSKKEYISHLGTGVHETYYEWRRANMRVMELKKDHKRGGFQIHEFVTDEFGRNLFSKDVTKGILKSSRN